MLIGFLLLSWLANILSLTVADWLFDGVSIGHWGPLLIGAAVLGIANTVVRPILTMITLPLVILTLGLGMIAINVAMLALAEWVAPDFSINGFWTYVGATIVVWLVNWVIQGAFRLRERLSWRSLIAPLVGYPLYALIAAFTAFTLVPDTKWEIIVLTGLAVSAFIGQAMDEGARDAAKRGDPTAEKYLRDWGLHRDD
jgi:putative membrane protein